jgi:predicted anti-sigma-YlaC factor YlaD
MKETNCDDILMAVMAAADGEGPGIAAEKIDAHIAGCESCRGEIEQAEAMAGMLQNYARSEEKADLWPVIEGQITPFKGDVAWSNWQVFTALTIALAAYKLIEMVPKNDPGYLLKIVPLLAAGALFIFLRENPFKINTELIPER